MTTAEQLIAEGEARGEARGIAEGEARGGAKLLLGFLTDKFGSVPAHIAQIVAAGDSDTIRVWLNRAAGANTLAKVFNR